MGIVFQGPSLLPSLDVLENVALPLLLVDTSAAEAGRLARLALQQVGIAELAPALPQELSGGQAQRVAVARVLACRPALILADEPTGQLDHRAGELVLDVLLSAADDLDAALLVATHDPLIARRLADHWTMRDGRVLTTGAASGHPMTAAIWVGGLLRRRPGRLIGIAAGIAVAVALLASLGAFLAHSQATMTDRAIRGVGVDWQVQVQPGADPESVDRTLHAAVGVARDAAVGFGTSAGLSATIGGSTQTTGPAVVVGLPADYRELFPAEVRTLAGADSGVLLAQQTAANLHAAPGDAVTIALQGLPPATVTVAGVVELPQADSLFQRVGAPAGTRAKRAAGQRAAAARGALAPDLRSARRRPPGPGRSADPRRARSPAPRRPSRMPSSR